MIRAARLDDLDQVATLVRASFDAKLHDFMVYAQHGVARFIGAYIALPVTGPTRWFLVDVHGSGQVRAFAEFQGGDDGTAFLAYICVAREARGMGLATALIDHFLAAAGAFTTLQLEVFAENHAAIALYRKLGFEQTGGTSWFVRDLPLPAQRSTLRVANAAEATAMYAHYGFCRYGLDWNGAEIALGRIGPSTIRCFRCADFADDELLGAMGGLLASTRRALYICSSDAADRPNDKLLFHTSLRLARNITTSRGN